MPHSQRFLTALDKEGYGYFTGVPCSLLSGAIRRLESDEGRGWVPAVREDSAIGLATGAWLGGRTPAVFMQNSGLGVCLNALASLNLIYQIPLLLVVSWRGRDRRDAPEHWIMGEISAPTFELLDLPWAVLDGAGLEEAVARVSAGMRERRLPGALLVPAGLLDG